MQFKKTKHEIYEFVKNILQKILILLKFKNNLEESNIVQKITSKTQ